MPSSSAVLTTAAVPSASSARPKLLQPIPTSEMSRLPSLAVRMRLPLLLRPEKAVGILHQHLALVLLGQAQGLDGGDRIGAGHVERIVAAQDDVIPADPSPEELQRQRIVGQRVEVQLAEEVAERRGVDVRLGL